MASHRVPGIAKWGVTLGVSVVLIYLGTALNVLRGPQQLLLPAVFAIGPVAIIGVLALVDKLGNEASGTPARVGTVYLVVAFALFTLMLVVQQGTRLQYAGLPVPADPVTVSVRAEAYRVANYVQLGLDVAFDIFYCLGIIAISIAMRRSTRFGTLIPVFGIISAASLLLANMVTFPYVPADHGLVDLGPATGLWWLAVIGRMHRLKTAAS